MNKIQTVISSKFFKISFQIAIFCLAIILGNLWVTRELPQGKALDFQVQDLQGNFQRIEFNTGEPILLHFFATWCPICELENNSINSISKDYHVILIAMQSGDANAIKNYIKEHGITTTVYNDEQGKVSQLYRVKGVPTSFIIDNKATIRSSVVGYSSEIGLRLRLWWYD